MSFFWSRASISDAELTAELDFWKDNFLGTACFATVFAVVGGALIAAWPADVGNPELRDFVKQLWPVFVEFAFWVGFLVGLLWTASRRIGCAFGGTVPWSHTKTPVASVCGQAACGLFFGACLLWGVMQFARQLGGEAMGLRLVLTQLVDAGFAIAAVCLLVALAIRPSAQKN